MLSSLDTNILVYAANEDAVEHRLAKDLVDEALQEPSKWILSDQVLFELYKALRNPKILVRPLDAAGAAKQVLFWRTKSGFLHCAYDLPSWETVFEILSRSDTSYQRTHDIVLGITLARNGVGRFYTRNTKDFEGLGIPQVINPIDL